VGDAQRYEWVVRQSAKRGVVLLFGGALVASALRRGWKPNRIAA
jgi:hypothetical protein